MKPRDICALGATTLPTRDLLALALRRASTAPSASGGPARLPAAGSGAVVVSAAGDVDELAAAEHALRLCGDAREAALRTLKAGPQLLAVVELGRRAWMLPSPVGRRVQGPVDVVAAVAPRVSGEELWLVACDVRLTIARIARVETEGVATLLQLALSAGTTRFAIARRRPTPAVPNSEDAELAAKVAAAARAVNVSFLDYVLLGDDGFASLRRLGLVPPSDPRYR